MKTGTDGNLKYMALKMRLGMPNYIITGVLESLWQMACKSAPAGDIGKHSNVMIAAGMEWQDDPDDLINALIETGWIDTVDDERRLLIHDWDDHCPEYIKKRKRAQQSRKKRSSAQNGAAVRTEAQQSRTDPSVCAIVKSSQAKPSQEENAQSGDCGSSPDSKIPNVEKLDELISAFEMLPSGVGHQVRDRRGKEIIKGWKRVQKDPEWRKAFDDIPTLMARIRDGTVMHGTNWFRFSWLFRTGELGEKNVFKILDKRYEQNGNSNARRDPARVESQSTSHDLFD